MLEMFGHASVVGKLGILVAVFTVAMAAAYAIRPSEARLALMRPLSLATIFAALGSFMASAAAILNAIAATGGPIGWGTVAEGAAESLAPMAGAFGSLTVAWILVAVGLRRHP